MQPEHDKAIGWQHGPAICDAETKSVMSQTVGHSSDSSIQYSSVCCAVTACGQAMHMLTDCYRQMCGSAIVWWQSVVVGPAIQTFD